MDLTIILIALGLAMDSFSVSIANGFNNKVLNSTDALKMGIFFGLFQAIMPVFGWLAGVNVIDFIREFDHWVAFVLLSFIGLRMIYESLREGSKKLVSSFNTGILLMLSIATSIDALAVGLSLSFLKVSIVGPAIITGIITFSLSFLGVYLGKRFGRFFKNKIEVLGGFILIIIGLKILFEHL
jgi:putative Mn2+ efflux pump MntP